MYIKVHSVAFYSWNTVSCYLSKKWVSFEIIQFSGSQSELRLNLSSFLREKIEGVLHFLINFSGQGMTILGRIDMFCHFGEVGLRLLNTPHEFDRFSYQRWTRTSNLISEINFRGLCYVFTRFCNILPCKLVGLLIDHSLLNLQQLRIAKLLMC